MTAVAALFLVISVFLCLRNWRLGIPLTLVAGFSQDLLRKRTEGEPVYFVLLSTLVLSITFVTSLRQTRSRALDQLIRIAPSTTRPGKILLGYLVLSGALTMVTTGSVVVVGVGLVSYLAPIPALMLAIQYAGEPRSVGRLMGVYQLLAAVSMLSVVVSYSGTEWSGFKQVGEALFVYTSAGKLELHAGILRTPEIAAWHAGAFACLTFLPAAEQRGSWRVPLRGLLVGGAIAVILLTGRRKHLAIIVVFVLTLTCLTLLQRLAGRSRRAGLLRSVIIVGTVGLVAFGGLVSDDPSFNPYLERSQTTFEDAPERFSALGVSNLYWVYERNGFFGSGVGTGSQGAQYFGAGHQIVGYAAEGGTGKILAELGVPGFLLILWLGGALLFDMWRLSSRVSRVQQEADLTLGILAILVANVAAYTTAHQVFGDPFVLIVLGLFAGILLGAPARIQWRARRMANRRTQPGRVESTVGTGTGARTTTSLTRKAGAFSWRSAPPGTSRGRIEGRT